MRWVDLPRRPWRSHTIAYLADQTALIAAKAAWFCSRIEIPASTRLTQRVRLLKRRSLDRPTEHEWRMIKNFDDIKAQLKELAPIINSFKSETVQLRIVELVFRAQQPSDETTDELPPTRPRKASRRKARTVAGDDSAPNGKSVRKRTSGAGPVPTLNQLLDEGFFNKHQTLNQLIDYCKSKKARIFKPSDFSGPLGRFIRDGLLEREKNDDAQYEYWKR